MLQAYAALNQLGVAHSIEISDGDQLLGGLYGVMLENVFFGESMFSDHTNGSKVALIALARLCQDNGVVMIDCQVHNPHLETMGAELVSRQVFEKHLEGAIKAPMNVILANPACLAPATKTSLEERLLVPLKRFAAELL
jgi:leucyl/phenylalanyl-tRNA--protein transferase